MKDSLPNAFKLLIAAIFNLRSNPELALVQSREAQAMCKRIVKKN